MSVKNVKIQCPICGHVPDKGAYWNCTCGHIWNTFDTKGRCPNCDIQWEDTACLICGSLSPHKNWYNDDIIPPENINIKLGLSHSTYQNSDEIAFTNSIGSILRPFGRNLKQNYLYFDKIYFIYVRDFCHTDMIRNAVANNTKEIYPKMFLKEFEDLEKLGLAEEINIDSLVNQINSNSYLNILFNRDESENITKLELNYIKREQEKRLKFWTDNKDIFDILNNAKSKSIKLVERLNKDPNNYLIHKEFIKSIHNVENLSIRIASYILRNSYDMENTMIFNEWENNLFENSRNESVLKIILNNFPSIDTNVSWEQLKEFKSDNDSKSRLKALKGWIKKVSLESLSIKEITEEYDELLYQYEKYLKIHKINISSQKIELLATATVETINDIIQKNPFGILTGLVKNFSKPASFLLQKGKMDFFEKEMGAPGREISYITKIKNDFK